MQFIWEEKDIKSGRYFARDDGSTKGLRKPWHYEPEYHLGTLHQIGYLTVDEISSGSKVAISLSDGATFRMGDGSAKEFADHLNEGRYSPITVKEALEIIARRENGD